MQMQWKPFTRLSPFPVAACLVVAAACGVPAEEASHPAALDEATTLSVRKSHTGPVSGQGSASHRAGHAVSRIRGRGCV
jgi:hypothetical protein